MKILNKLNDLTLSGVVKCQQRIHAIGKDERGVTMIEYVMLAVLITTMIVALWKTNGIQKALEAAVSQIQNNISSVSSNATP